MTLRKKKTERRTKWKSTSKRQWTNVGLQNNRDRCERQERVFRYYNNILDNVYMQTLLVMPSTNWMCNFIALFFADW